MQIIDNYLPLNSKDKIDELVKELASKGLKSNSAYREIFQKIQKYKIQAYFQQTYPENTFTDTPSAKLIKENQSIGSSSTNSQGAKSVSGQQKVQKQSIQIPLPPETLGQNKYIYGTYIEMAFHNFFLTISHVYSLVTGLNVLREAQAYRGQIVDYANEKTIWNPMFDTFRHGSPEERLKTVELLNKHFPMLKPFLEYTRHGKNSKYREYDELDILERLSRFMRILRDVYSHYRFVPYENQLEEYNKTESFIIYGLNLCFLGSKREVKHRFAYTDKEMLCAEEYTGRKIEGKMEKRQGFHYSLAKKQDDDTVRIKNFGLVFFVSLFLEKKYSKILCDKTNVVKYEDEKVICEMLAIYNIRLHVQKLTVTKDADALALDIINELQRCPKQLFEMLPPTEQSKFRIKSKSSTDISDVLMIRHRDRFATMVMKYIDDAKIFQDIRFQVSLGKYFFKFYNKKCIDSSEPDRVRSLCKEIHGFGRLSEIDEAHKEIWADSIREYEDYHRNTADEKPYITDQNAQYMISGNRIGMHICADDQHLRLPEVTADGAKNESPDCFMSCYEIPAMAFLIHLKGGGEYVEGMIKSAIANYRKLFTDIRDGNLQPVGNKDTLNKLLVDQYGGIHIEGLPTNIRQYLLMQQVDVKTAFMKWAEEFIRQQIEYTQQKKERFSDELKIENNSKMNKIGKKSYIVIKPGRLADYMAKDMMMFQPNDENNRGKLTGLNFRILQSVLATYNGEMDALMRVLRNAHLLGEGGNPIVNSMFSQGMEYSNTKDIYKEYLVQRVKYLQSCLRKRQFEELEFLHSNRTCWSDRNADFYRQLAGRYIHSNQGDIQCDKALELPRGLFEKEIRKELAEIEGTKNIASDRTKNIAYLVYAYFKNVMLDDCQPFYEYKRCYPLFNKLYRKTPTAGNVYFNATEIRDKLNRKSHSSIRKDIECKQSDERNILMDMLSALKKTETDLKRQKIEDMILFLIAQRILIGSTERGSDAVRFDAFSSLKLRDLLSEDVMSRPISLKIKIKSQNGVKKSVYQDEIKLKDYSRFYRFLSDRRLPTLLDLTNSFKLSQRDIETEFSNYDKVHPTVLQEVFNYERRYLESQPNVEGVGSTEFSEIIRNDPELSLHSDMLTNIRNSFAHGHYPNGQKVQVALQSEIPEKARKVSETFVFEMKK